MRGVKGKEVQEHFLGGQQSQKSNYEINNDSFGMSPQIGKLNKSTKRNTATIWGIPPKIPKTNPGTPKAVCSLIAIADKITPRMVITKNRMTSQIGTNQISQEKTEKRLLAELLNMLKIRNIGS